MCKAICKGVGNLHHLLNTLIESKNDGIESQNNRMGWVRRDSKGCQVLTHLPQAEVDDANLSGLRVLKNVLEFLGFLCECKLFTNWINES